MGSFAGVQFYESGDEFPSYSSRVQGRILRIPGGDQTIVQRNPSSVHTLSTTAECTGAQLAALRAQVGLFGDVSAGGVDAWGLLLRVDPQRVFQTDTYLVGLEIRIFRGYGEAGYGVIYGN